jgi:acetylornithine deacetylase/succinyl-diaminopimelate desuccinylase-like protein
MTITDSTARWVEQQVTSSILPALVDYIRIPNKSPSFDPDWQQHGHMERAVALCADWARQHIPADARLDVLRLGERTPLIFIEVPGRGPRGDDTVLLYGHLDKQPEMTGWRAGLGPWEPVLEGDKLYGRGGADDGYALFSALTAIAALRRDDLPHARCLVLIEACEESGSDDLPAYIEHLTPRIGELSLVVCLDSGCANYDQLWSTTSLRGLVMGTLELQRVSVWRGRCSIASRTRAPARSSWKRWRPPSHPGAQRRPSVRRRRSAARSTTNSPCSGACSR